MTHNLTVEKERYFFQFAQKTYMCKYTHKKLEHISKVGIERRHSTLKGKILALSEELRKEKNAME